MIRTLQSQLCFMQAMQSVDTTNIEPLQSICDETEAGLREATISLKHVQPALDQEKAVGYNKRPRRQRDQEVNTAGIEDWDALGTASRTTERFFVVKCGRP